MGRLGISCLSKGYKFTLLPAFYLSKLCISWFIHLYSFNRLLSQDKRILVRNNVSYNGLTPKEPCMVCNRLILRCSPRELISQNSITWLKKPKGELKLLGMLQNIIFGLTLFETDCWFKLSFCNYQFGFIS